MSGLYPRGKVVVRPINRARTTTSPLPSCAHNLCMHNRRTTSRTTGDCEVEAGASRARHVQMLATSRGRRAPSARAPAPWASRDVRGAPARLPSPVGAAPHRSRPPSDYQSGSIGKEPMKQCVTGQFANDSHSGRSMPSAVSCLPGAA